MEVSHAIYIDFTDEWYEADISFERHDDVFDKFYQLKHIDEVCINHMCWAKFNVGNPTEQTLTELAEEFKAQTKKIIDSMHERPDPMNS